MAMEVKAGVSVRPSTGVAGVTATAKATDPPPSGTCVGNSGAFSSTITQFLGTLFHSAKRKLAAPLYFLYPGRRYTTDRVNYYPLDKANDQGNPQVILDCIPAVLTDEEDGNWASKHPYDYIQGFPKPESLLRPLANGQTLTELRSTTRAFIAYDGQVLTFRHGSGAIAKLVSRARGEFTEYKASVGMDVIAGIDSYHGVTSYASLMVLPSGREWALSDGLFYRSGYLLQTGQFYTGYVDQVWHFASPCIQKYTGTDASGDVITKTPNELDTNAGQQLQLVWPVWFKATGNVYLRVVQNANISPWDKLELHIYEGHVLVGSLNSTELEDGVNKKSFVVGTRRLIIEGQSGIVESGVDTLTWSHDSHRWHITGDLHGLDVLVYDLEVGMSFSPTLLD